eukprot:Plantae.Rhodophyta-Purpureofilum_apyrenoidigerum.ctg4712.p1 GENE.Plantae.Rhodophyta-Purpureofilum_apyrenoidigerum.ctg4712~~Plantae.Rhodophyta-Purpureofilum_apyrenoidigerum.ctg4712.p1  ORF type:complete len:368 (+),score=43.44 Plantae.Rhodophyta-Purpureofilum_apyrenoidigerum.ctg4712:359-1462(+)
MGAKLTKVVFSPPQPPTYSEGEDETMMFIRRKVFGDREPLCESVPLRWIQTDHNSVIPAVLVKAKNPHEPKYTWILSHGTSEDLGIVARWAAELSEALGVDVLCYDYTGYGIAGGTPSEESCYADIRAVYRHLCETCNINPETIIAFGRSLGCGPTIDLAARETLGGVILVSPFLSCLRVVLKTVQAPPVRNKDMFCNIDKIKLLEAPLMVVHGKQDKLIPIRHGQELFRRAQNRCRALWIETADHNDVESCHRELVLSRYATFIEEVDAAKLGVEVQPFEETVTSAKEVELPKLSPRIVRSQPMKELADSLRNSEICGEESVTKPRIVIKKNGPARRQSDSSDLKQNLKRIEERVRTAEFTLSSII